MPTSPRLEAIEEYPNHLPSSDLIPVPYIDLELGDLSIKAHSGILNTTGIEGIVRIFNSLSECINLRGEIVEFGTFCGHTAVLMSAIAKRRIWVFDSFEGLPEKSRHDGNTSFYKGQFNIPELNVQRMFEIFCPDYPPIITKGFFCDLRPSHIPNQIAFAHLDGDLYESISQSLALVYPKLVRGAHCLIHDYYNQDLPGCKIAVDEFLKNKMEKIHIITKPEKYKPCHAEFIKL